MACTGHTNPWSCITHKNDSLDAGNIYRNPCPSNIITYTDANIVSGNTTIKTSHINDLRNAINKEQLRRKNLVANAGPSAVKPSDPCPSNVVTNFGTGLTIGTKLNYNLLTDLRNAINKMKTISWSKSIGAIDETPKADVIVEIRSKLRELETECLCNCNYCTCNCNYCTCFCNYSCTCNCNYCTCNCNYCTCVCAYCTCNCAYSCTCNCNYNCTCNCNYNCTCNCNYNCTCNCDYSCTCNCNYGCICNTQMVPYMGCTCHNVLRIEPESACICNLNKGEYWVEYCTCYSVERTLHGCVCNLFADRIMGYW